MNLEARYLTIKNKIKTAVDAAGRSESDVTLVAVSKTHPIEAVANLYALGHRDFGENYAQELIQKAVAAQNLGLDQIRWHFIGHLQSNKVKSVLSYIHMIHSVDSLSLAQEISKRAQTLTPARKVRCLLSVNIDQEPTKSGLLPDEVASISSTIATLTGVELCGLMCIPDPLRAQKIPNAFSRLRALGASLGGIINLELSMGMTGDFETAIREGATAIRIGTAIFGERE